LGNSFSALRNYQLFIFTVLCSVFLLLSGDFAHSHNHPAASVKVEVEREIPELSDAVYEQLVIAQGHAGAAKYGAAEATLNDILDGNNKKGNLNRYELANIYNTYAYLRYAVEDYSGAATFYEKVIDQRPYIPLALEINTLYTVAQLYFLQENWSKGIETMNQWMAATDAPTTNAYALLANGYFQLFEYDKSLENIEIAISREDAAGKPPKEQWYYMARFIHLDRDDYRKALDTVEVLVSTYPKYKYFKNASELHNALGDTASEIRLLEEAVSFHRANKLPSTKKFLKDLETLCRLHFDTEDYDSSRERCAETKTLAQELKDSMTSLLMDDYVENSEQRLRSAQKRAIRAEEIARAAEQQRVRDLAAADRRRQKLLSLPEVTCPAIIAELNANEVRARVKYPRDDIRVTGTILDINVTSDGRGREVAQVLIRDSGDILNGCIANMASFEEAVELDKGNSFEFLCSTWDETAGNVLFKDCRSYQAYLQAL
jgi:tetratricopeptide (TPR) repeat protein